jgi:DNA polymerase-3 subunit alpha
MNDLTQAVTHFSGQLHEAAHEEHVRVAGMITRIRHHQTKTGKAMAFVALEDLQGVIELVVFPKVWDRLAEVIDYDRIVLVDGKVDNQGSEPKVLVDNITTDFSLVVPADQLPPKGQASQTSSGSDGEKTPHINGISPRGKTSVSQTPPTNQPAPIRRDVSAEDIPPPPDEFPSDWVALETNSANLGVLAALVFAESLPGVSNTPVTGVNSGFVETTSEVAPESISSNGDYQAIPPPVSLPAAAAVIDSIPPASGEPESDLSKEYTEAVLAESPALNDTGFVSDAAEPPVGIVQQYLVSPMQTEPGEIVHMITIVLRSSGDKTRDVLRLRRIHGTVMSYPGKDRFAFHVFERGHGYLVEFPNFTTGLCPELISRLRLLVGTDLVRIEPITFQ